MKKLSLALLGTTILATTAMANTYQSPVLRGEITQTITNTAAANLLTTSVKNLPTPAVNVSNVSTVATVLIPANTAGTTQLDVTLLDEFIEDIKPNARHYPTNFPSRTADFVAKENVKYLSDWIEPYASAPDASFDVAIRAAKINGMARNLNLGTDYTLRATAHMKRALELKPNDAEANFLLGMMLSETGAFKEGRKYLDKAAADGYVEAEQSIAQAELISDNKAAALKRLRALASKYPNNTQLAEQIRIIESGGFYIWNIADNQLNIKSLER